MKTETRVIDNRVFLLGLDELYREAIKPHEMGDLLQCAELVAADLGLAPANVPVEGYYSENTSLETYFRLMRAIQDQKRKRASEIHHKEAFDRLKAVSESPIFGVPHDKNSEQLIRRMRNALNAAVEKHQLNLTVEIITNAAHELASSSDDISLVSVAALARDSAVLAALGESFVLYSHLPAILGIPEKQPTVLYDWRVDPAIENRARLFVNEFNMLLDESLPEPCAQNAAPYWHACNIEKIVGRCVVLARNSSVQPPMFYHWAVERHVTGTLEVLDFWHSELWTTARFRASSRGTRRRLRKPRDKSRNWWRFWN